METYAELSVHQRINCKANCLIHYKRMNLGYIIRRHPGMFGYDSLLLEAPGVNNNRNYEPPEPDYNGWSQGSQ